MKGVSDKNIVLHYRSSQKYNKTLMYYVFRCLMTSFYISNFLNTASRAIFSNLSSNGFKSLYLKSGFLFCSAFEITKSATSGFLEVKDHANRYLESFHHRILHNLH